MEKTLFPERNRYAAELYELIAWILFDAGYHQQSWDYNIQGLLYSKRAGESGIRNFILSNMNLHTLVNNEFIATHYLSEFAVKNLSLPQSAHALFHSRDAIAHAHTGNHDTAKKLITTAESIFSYRNGRKEQYWSSWINETIILWHKALTYNACKDYDRALEILENASKKLNSPHTRVSKIIDHTTQNIHNRKLAYANIWKHD